MYAPLTPGQVFLPKLSQCPLRFMKEILNLDKNVSPLESVHQVQCGEPAASADPQRLAHEERVSEGCGEAPAPEGVLSRLLPRVPTPKRFLLADI